MPRTKAVPSNGTTATAVAPIALGVSIRPIQEGLGHFRIKGTAPYMQCRFSQKAIHKIEETHKKGQQGRSRRTREARDFDDDYKQAMHLFEDGTCGIPAASFRNALISCCRLVGFKMTIAKLSIFTMSDGLDIVDGQPLVRIEGRPEPNLMPVRNATGVIDLRMRPIWREWAANLRIRFDMEQFSPDDVTNLLIRAGRQVGIGEGRPDSRDSNGLGYGLFDVEVQNGNANA
jgi:hypothetical protein